MSNYGSKYAKDTGSGNHDDTHPIYRRRKNRRMTDEPTDVLGEAMGPALTEVRAKLWKDLWDKVKATEKVRKENAKLKVKLAAEHKTVISQRRTIKNLRCKLG